MKKLLPLLVLTAASRASLAQCDTTNAVFNSIVSRYEQSYQALAPDTVNGPWSKTGEIGWLGKITVAMKEKKVSFDVIEVTMKNRRLAFNTPQVTMRNKKMSFTTVETVMVTNVIGYKPEFKCCPLKTKMSKIYGKTPSTRRAVKSFSTSIPEFKYATTSIVTKVPEFRKETRELKFKLPEVTVVTQSAYAKAQEAEAKELGRKYEDLSNAQKKEMTTAVIGSFECQKNALATQRTSIAAEFTTSLAELDKSITSLQANGLNPAELEGEDGSKVNLLQVKAEVESQMSASLKSLDEALAQILEKEKTVVEAL